MHEKKNSKEERISRTNDIAIAKRRLPISQPNQATAEETALAGEKRMNKKIDNFHDVKFVKSQMGSRKECCNTLNECWRHVTTNLFT
ncbi:MAG: hypothetical protein Q8J76_07245 [Desulfobulbaceae bacterium]|nr:hypothetical protein [Desulfobulbaceae bacterium]